MSDKAKTTRRLFLGSTVAVSTLIAGCSGQGGADTETPTDAPTDTTTRTATETTTDTATETATETQTEEPTTVENFSYPAGASRDGIRASELFQTHRSAIVEGESATVSIDQATDRDGHASSVSLTNRYGPNGVSQVKEAGKLTESLWAPSGEDAGYVEMDTGFEQRYRIDNQAPDPQAVLRLRLIQRLLAGGQWSDATTVVETAAGEPAVVYESTGIANEQDLLRVVFGDELSEFEATISVTEAGYLSGFSYEMTVERDTRTVQQQMTAVVEMVGQTTVEEPSWAGTAQENGVQFTASVSDDAKAIVLELENGEVPTGIRVQLSSGRFDTTTLSESVTAGDTLYLSFSEDNSLVVGRNEMPSDSTALEDFAFVNLRDGDFVLFEKDISF